MTLMHFTDAETLTVESRAQDGPHPRRHFKPNGLWVSDESEGSDGWRSWCADNESRLGRNAFAIELALDASVLTLATPEAIREFDAEFGTGDRYRVAWDRVAARWQGILITPYQWSLRLSDVDWYYPWDCASGCIWDAAAIASVTPIAAEAVTS